jgi:peptidase S41-like protein
MSIAQDSVDAKQFPTLVKQQRSALHGQTAVLSVFLLVFFLGAGRGLGQTTIPDTPAGRTLRAWLDAFNSGDRAKIEAYIHTQYPDGNVDAQMGFREQSGGFELLAIEGSEPLLIKFRVKEKASPTVALGTLQVKDGQPPTIEEFNVRAIPPGAVVEDVKLDAGSRQRVIDGVIANLGEFYVYPETAQKMEDAVRAHQKNGDYDSVTDGGAFAALLTEQLQGVSHDHHLRVNYSPFKRQASTAGPNPAEQEAQMRRQMERINCGFEKVEILPRNIGYVKFNMFANPDICGPTVVSAMSFLAHVDAIIFDLRENGGGDPRMVALISTYLFDQPTHLNDLYNRKEDSTTQYWTLPFVPGAKLTDKPAFVLTSKSTFSGGEEFTYNLKNLKRATIVGETTGGGAHPVSGHPIGDHFMIGVPFARAVNPITKTNWEGTGVEPDVQAKASDALDVAQKLAGEKLAAGRSQRN